MPKGFSEAEKEQIRVRLLDKGKQFFSAYGIKKTNVEELTNAVGISKGAFYLFFPSKEELFFEIVEQFEAEYRASLFDGVFEPGQTSRENFKALLRKAFAGWKRNPLFRKFGKEEYEYLLRKLPDAAVRAHVEADEVFTVEFIERCAREGIVIEHDPRLVAGLMRALFFVSMHEDDFADALYGKVIEALVDSTAAYLVKESSQ